MSKEQSMSKHCLCKSLVTLVVLAAAAGCPYFLWGAKANGKADARLAPTNFQTISPLPDGEWTLPAGDYANTRYSPLDQINTKNVSNLKIIGTMSTGIPHGHEGQPLVVNGTMYVVTPFPNDLIALDLSKPGFPMKWKYEPRPDPQSQGVACCDVVNRGASYADGKIV